MIFKIALRNILRHKRRTFLSAITIAVGLAIFILFDSLMSGADRTSLENMVNLTDGSLKIFTKEYAEERMAFPLKYGIGNIDSVVAYVKKQPEIDGAVSRITFLSEIIGGSHSIRVVGSVIDPETDGQVFTLGKYIARGRYFSNAGGNEILIGKKLAQDLEITVGDIITLAARTRHETHNAMDFEVTGLLETASPFINESGVFITFQAADSLLDARGLVTELALHVPWSKTEDMAVYLRRVNKIRDKINARFAALTTRTFYDANAGFIEMMAGKRKGQSLITFFILLIGAVGIVNTVLMSVYERIREVGVLRALGLTPKQIRTMFLCEGMLIGLAGSVMGCLTGFFLNIWLVNAGFDVTSFYKDFDASQFPVWGVFYGQWNIKIFIASFILGISIATLAAIVPARKAAKIKPTECLKFV
ncbi:MAG: ABC transporter permease [Bacillota bacterium]